MNSKKAFMIAVLIPLLILLGMLIKPALTVYTGQEIQLETKAIDPTDLFRGDYVAVRFKINDIPISKITFKPEQLINQEIYVQLKQTGKYFEVDQVSLERPGEGVYLKGRLQYFDNREIHLDYSLDKYFVKQGTGLELERASTKGELIGTVKVYKGYGILTGLAKR